MKRQWEGAKAEKQHEKQSDLLMRRESWDTSCTIRSRYNSDTTKENETMSIDLATKYYQDKPDGTLDVFVIDESEPGVYMLHPTDTQAAPRRVGHNIAAVKLMRTTEQSAPEQQPISDADTAAGITQETETANTSPELKSFQDKDKAASKK